jgi:glycosyltransferase involved in cell wall biosynthesis
VRDRIRATYGVDAEVLPPAVSTSVGSGQPIQRLAPGYVLCASRLLRYKNVDAVVSAFDLLDDARLVVVGDGPERRRLHALAGNNVTFLGRVTDAELRWLYMNCAGLVSAAYEDFGLTPVEAAAIGKPAAVLRAGGFLDTVVDGQTGLFFDALRPESIALAVTCLLNRTWDSRLIRAHAERFGEDRFTEGLRRTVFAETAHAA